jgi:hypothetical protein
LAAFECEGNAREFLGERDGNKLEGRGRISLQIQSLSASAWGL